MNENAFMLPEPAQENDRIKAFLGALYKSIRSIVAPYFQVERFEAPPAYRERAYCYELYHQLRRRLPLQDTLPYVLHGEIDKRGHQILQQLIGAEPNPDFVYHIPGMLIDNLVVMEVKTHDMRPDKTTKDIEKLTLMTRDAIEQGLNYQLGIFLIFGPTLEQEIRDHLAAELEMSRTHVTERGQQPRIMALWHREVGAYPLLLANHQEWLLGNQTEDA